ncbi:MAG: phosphoserine aminotransferase, partial [Kiloniellales bacterium]
EAQHGMLALSPRAVERLEGYTPPWPVPKLFRLVKDGRLNEAIFRGETINTVSMLCVEDAIDGLKWAESVGGLPVLVARAETNAAALGRWVERATWVDFLAADVRIRSTTSVCLKIIDPWFTAMSEAEQRALIKAMAVLLEEQMVGFDIAGHRDAPPGLRIWCGATVETADIESLTAWLDWAYEQVRARETAAA